MDSSLLDGKRPMRKIITVIMLISTLVACATTATTSHIATTTTTSNNTVVLTQPEYQLSHKKEIKRKLNENAMTSIVPIDSGNEILLNTINGAEFIDRDGAFKNTYNEQKRGLIDQATNLLAQRVVGDHLILSYTDHVATLQLPDNHLLSKLEKPSGVNSARVSGISANGYFVLAFRALWDLTTGNKLDFFKPEPTPHDASINAEFSPDSRYLIITTNLLTQTKAQLWDLTNQTVKYNWKLDGTASAMFSPDSKILIFDVSASPHSKVSEPQFIMYSVDTGEAETSLNFASPVTAGPIVIDDQHLVSAHENGEIRIWSYRSKAVPSIYHGDAMVTPMVMDTQSRIWCGLDNGKLIVIDNGHFSLVHTFNDRVTRLAVLGDKLFVEVFAQPDGRFTVYDISRAAN